MNISPPILRKEIENQRVLGASGDWFSHSELVFAKRNDRVHGRRSIGRDGACRQCCGGMRRTHLRGHGNILKRLLVHVGAFNLGLLMRRLIGVGTPRGPQGRVVALLAMLCVFMDDVRGPETVLHVLRRLVTAVRARFTERVMLLANATCTTGC